MIIHDLAPEQLAQIVTTYLRDASLDDQTLAIIMIKRAIQPYEQIK